MLIFARFSEKAEARSEIVLVDAVWQDTMVIPLTIRQAGGIAIELLHGLWRVLCTS